MAIHLELRHLRSIRAIHEAGGLARAAERLGLTQSALSHQIRGIEERAGVPLVVRRSKPMRLAAAGRRLLALADRVLPQIDAAEAEIFDLRARRAGRLHVAVACPASLDWLLPVLASFRRAWPEVDVDARARAGADPIAALRREEVDLVVSSEVEAAAGLAQTPLFDYEAVLLAAPDHPLADRPFVAPTDLAGETLVTHQVERAWLDAFAGFLTPAGVEPADHREVELTDVMLMHVAARRGVAVLPDWVAAGHRGDAGLVVRPLGPGGLIRRLYAAARPGELSVPYIAHLVSLARRGPVTGRRVVL